MTFQFHKLQEALFRFCFTVLLKILFPISKVGFSFWNQQTLLNRAKSLIVTELNWVFDNNINHKD